MLAGVDRKTALKHIVDSVTKEARTPTEQHLAILSFLQKASFHNIINFREPDGTTIYDPLVYLELGEMWCGDVSIVAIELFAAAGYPARMAQLGGHQIAEVYYENEWHYCDADMFGNGETVRMADGRISSVVELSLETNRALLDRLASGPEVTILSSCLNKKGGLFYPAYFYFSRHAYDGGMNIPQYYIKTATAAQEREDRDYGWDYYQTMPDSARILFDSKLQYTLDGVAIEKVHINRSSQEISLTFHASDRDGYLVGYRIFLSETSRGWDYHTFFGSKQAKTYWSNPDGWKPEMYANLFQLPPHEVALITTQAEEAAIPLTFGKTYYITIMAFDEYGERVGRTLYPASNKLKICLSE